MYTIKSIEYYYDGIVFVRPDGSETKIGNSIDHNEYTEVSVVRTVLTSVWETNWLNECSDEDKMYCTTF